VSTLTEVLLRLSEVLIVLALLLALLRLVRGPRGADRLLAAETVALGLVGLLLLQAGAGDARLYVDAALGLALFSFVGAVVFAHVAERGELHD
jgi:multicomponent Na+:H+ antiporter subunit F